MQVLVTLSFSLCKMDKFKVFLNLSLARIYLHIQRTKTFYQQPASAHSPLDIFVDRPSKERIERLEGKVSTLALVSFQPQQALCLMFLMLARGLPPFFRSATHRQLKTPLTFSLLDAAGFLQIETMQAVMERHGSVGL